MYVQLLARCRQRAIDTHPRLSHLFNACFILVDAFVCHDGSGGTQTHLDCTEAIIQRHVWLPNSCLSPLLHCRNEIVPFDRGGTVVISTVSWNLVNNAVHSLDVRAVKHCLLDGVGRWWLTSVFPHLRIWSLIVVHLVFWKIRLQPTL